MSIPTVTRAKMRCAVEKRMNYGREDAAFREYEFNAVYDASSPEDQRYAKATPTAHIEITVDNPNVVFVPGKSYYVDFIPLEES